MSDCIFCKIVEKEIAGNIAMDEQELQSVFNGELSFEDKAELEVFWIQTSISADCSPPYMPVLPVLPVSSGTSSSTVAFSTSSICTYEYGGTTIR